MKRNQVPCPIKSALSGSAFTNDEISPLSSKREDVRATSASDRDDGEAASNGSCASGFQVRRTIDQIRRVVTDWNQIGYSRSAARWLSPDNDGRPHLIAPGPSPTYCRWFCRIDQLGLD